MCNRCGGRVLVDNYAPKFRVAARADRQPFGHRYALDQILGTRSQSQRRVPAAVRR